MSFLRLRRGCAVLVPAVAGPATVGFSSSCGFPISCDWAWFRPGPGAAPPTIPSALSCLLMKPSPGARHRPTPSPTGKTARQRTLDYFDRTVQSMKQSTNALDQVAVSGAGAMPGTSVTLGARLIKGPTIILFFRAFSKTATATSLSDELARCVSKVCIP